MLPSATVDDVARRAGVSRQTVSNVLNKPEIVRTSTRDTVLAAIQELAYRPSAAARRLRTRRSSTIGIHLDPYRGGISGIILDRFIHSLTELSGERGLRMMMYSARSHDDEIARLADLVDSAEIDAAVVTGTGPGDERTRWLATRGLPFVAFGRPWGDGDMWSSTHPWVDVDGAAGTRAATAHAVEVFGPRTVWLGWPPDRGTGDDRERGWREELAARGIQGRVVRTVDSVSAARAAAALALRDGEEIDAFVCASDSLAVGAHLAALDAGRGAIGLVGFDNTPVAEALGISSVEQSPELVAGATLDLLTDDTGGRIVTTEPRAADHTLVEPRLIVR